jgi:hypothetical protein
MSDLTRDERIRLIKKALKDCSQEVTREAVKRQYEYETGEPYEKEGDTYIMYKGIRVEGESIE